jgi:large subunit ribosomal protein L6
MIIEIPNGVKAEVKGNGVIITGSLGANHRIFNDMLLSVNARGNSIEITPSNEKKLAKKAGMSVNSLAKELRNDMLGVTKHFEKNMSIVFAHFPMTVELKGNELMIKNMIGERAPRKASVEGAAKVDIKGQNIRIYGTKLEDVSQTAANIRKVSKIRKKDERIFQDGVYYAIQ